MRARSAMSFARSAGVAVIAVVVLGACGTSNGTSAAPGADTTTAPPAASAPPAEPSSAPSTAPTLDVAEINGSFADDANGRKALDGLGEEAFGRAARTADMFVGLAHGDCGRLSGTDKGTTAVYVLFTPDQVDEVMGNMKKYFIMPSETTVRFPQQQCTGGSVTHWKVDKAGSGTKKSPLVISGTASTRMYPTNDKPLAATQKFLLSLVNNNGENATFGWQVSAADTSKITTEYLEQ